MCYNVVVKAAVVVTMGQRTLFDRENKMKIYREPIYVFEAIMYLMRRMNDQPLAEDVNKLIRRHPGHEEELEAAFAPIVKLGEYLDEHVDVSSERHSFFFKPIIQTEESDSEPTRYCNVQCCGYMLLCQGIYKVIRFGLPDEQAFEHIRSMSDSDLMNILLEAVKLEHPDNTSFSSFFDCISSNLSSAELKFALLDLFMHRNEYIDELEEMLMPICAIIREQLPLIKDLLDGFGELTPAEETEGGSFLSYCKFVVNSPETTKKIYPFLMGLADYAVVGPDGSSEEYVIGGVFRAKVIRFSADDTQKMIQLKNITKLIGDSSRFDMLLYLRDHKAYGQEIAKEMDLFFTTVSHHLNKLSAAGLLGCKLVGGKGYYTMNKLAVYNFCNNLKTTLLGDWCPDEEQK